MFVEHLTDMGCSDSGTGIAEDLINFRLDDLLIIKLHTGYAEH
jgi:hypothetical protein